MSRDVTIEPHAARLARMRKEFAALDYQVKRCHSDDFLRLNRQLQLRKAGLKMVMALKD